MKKLIIVFLILVVSKSVSAQETGSRWMSIGLIYSNLSYEEPGVMTEKGGNGGVQAEFIYRLGTNFSASIFGSYWEWAFIL